MSSSLRKFGLPIEENVLHVANVGAHIMHTLNTLAFIAAFLHAWIWLSKHPFKPAYNGVFRAIRVSQILLCSFIYMFLTEILWFSAATKFLPAFQQDFFETVCPVLGVGAGTFAAAALLARLQPTHEASIMKAQGRVVLPEP